MDLNQMRRRVLDRMPRGGRRWYDIRNQGSKATIRLYDEIGFWGVTEEDFAQDLDQITADEIEVQISSDGGDVFAGIAIYNLLRMHSARVTTRVDGLAASIASVIVQAGDHRVMVGSSQQMIHPAWGVAIGPASEMREFADLLDKQTDVIAGIYAERSGQDLEVWRDKLAGPDVWMTADEAVEAGLADEVLTPPRQTDPANKQDRTLHDELSEAMGVVSAAINSAERVGALRAEAGKTLSHVNAESLAELQAHMSRLSDLLTTPTDESDNDEAMREFARFVALKTTQGA